MRVRRQILYIKQWFNQKIPHLAPLKLKLIVIENTMGTESHESVSRVAGWKRDHNAKMLDKFAKAAQGLFGGGDEVDRILALPITQIRLDLKKAFQGKSFSADDFEKTVARLMPLDPNLAPQLAVVRQAIKDRAVANVLDIELDTPAKTALWAAAFMRMMEEGAEHGPLVQAKIWGQMKDSLGIFNEGIRVARVISSSLQNDDATFDWGQPGSWFYYDPEKNHINLDMFMTLMMGFEHMRVVHLHEIGHSELSNTFPPRMAELYDKARQVVDPATLRDRKSAPPKATAAEQEQLARESAEWQLRFMLWHMVEDNCVNKFAANMEKILPIQDFSVSWNHIGVSLQGYGELARGDHDKAPEDVTSDMPRAKNVKERFEKFIGQLPEDQQKRAKEDYLKSLNSPISDAEAQAIKAGKISLPMAQRMFHMSKMIVWLSFYQRTGLFQDTDKGWAKFKVFKDDINRTIDVSGIAEAKGRSAFDYLYELSVGAKGVSQQQPRPSDRLMGPEHYRRKVEETSAARNALMEKIWDIYLAPYAKVLQDDFVQKMQQRQQNKQNGQQQNQQGQSQGQSQGQPQQGEGQGQPQKGEGQGQPGQDGQQGQSQNDQQGQKPDHADPSQGQGSGQPQPQDGQQPDKNNASDKNGQGQSADKDTQQKAGGGEKQEIDEELEKQLKDMAATPADKKKQEHADEDAENREKAEQNRQQSRNGKEQDANAQEGEGQESQDGQDGQDGQEQGKAKPDAAKQGEGESEGEGAKAGWDQDPDADGAPKKVGDMRQQNEIGEDMTAEQKERLREAAQQMQQGQPQAFGNNAGKSAFDLDLTKLAKGDWRDFEKRALELAPLVNQVARSFEQIREKQRREIINISQRQHDFQPPDGDFEERFDRDKRLERVFKMQSGQRLEIDDFKAFRDDNITTAESSIEMTFMIDGSGSMPQMRLPGGVTAMEAALQSAVIMYMAARKVDIDAYIVMWGNMQPLIIATPDSNLKEVGRKLEQLRNGTNSGTDLSPGIRSTIGAMADYRAKPGTISGSSHIFVYSDGDIGDAAATQADLLRVAKDGRNLSVDVAVFRPSPSDAKTSMERVFEGVIQQTGTRQIGVLRGSDPNDMPRQLARTVFRRVNAIEVKGEPDRVKRDQLKNLHKKFTA